MNRGNGTTGSIPIQEIKSIILNNLESYLTSWFPKGKKSGHTYRMGDISGSKGNSLSVELGSNGKRGLWIDAATGEGGDIIDLYAAWRYLPLKAAILELAKEVGIELEENRKAIEKAEFDMRVLEETKVRLETAAKKGDLDGLLGDDFERLIRGTFEEIEEKTKEEEAIDSLYYNPTKNLNHLPPIKWLIKGWLPAEQCLIEYFGDPGSCKSLAAIDMALCIASGNQWCGITPKHTGSVIYICGEGHIGITKRIRAWFDSRNTPPKTLPFYATKAPIRFGNTDDPESIRTAVDAISEICDGVKERCPAIIIVDTVARNMFGNENDSKDMGHFISDLDTQLKAKYDCPVLIVHHSGHGDKNRERGHSSLRGALDAQYKFEDVGNEGEKVIKIGVAPSPGGKPPKDWEPPIPVYMSLKQIALPFVDEDGQPQTSVYMEKLEEYEEMKGKPKDQSGNAPTRETFLDSLELIARRRMDIESTPWVYTQAWKEYCISKNIGSDASFRKYKSRLIKSGDIVEDGPCITISRMANTTRKVGV